VLSARHRLHRPADFSAVIRYGARAGRSAVVVHLLPAEPAEPAESAESAESAEAPMAGADPSHPAPSRVGFVVPRAVGPAVVRNQVTRRLRALSTDRIDRCDLFPPGSRTVIRALPTAAVTPYAQLGEQLDSALAAAARRAGLEVGR
jgi:ribonuclease P protein component